MTAWKEITFIYILTVLLSFEPIGQYIRGIWANRDTIKKSPIDI